MKRVIEIVKAHLVAGGFDGLLQEDAECGCELADLVPCCGDFGGCTPAYRGPDPTGEGDWRMYGSKEAAQAANPIPSQGTKEQP